MTEELYDGPDVPAVPPVSETGRRLVAIDPDELAQLRRWLLAVSLGRATKDDHAAIRDYLREIGW